MLKRVWYYVTRKKMKTLIMALVLFGISVAMLSGIAIKKAMEVSTDKLYDEIGAGFTVVNNMMYNMGTSKGAGNIPREMVDELDKLSGVKDSVKRMHGMADLVNAEKIPLSSNMSESDQQYIKTIDFLGIDKSEYDSKFLAGTLKLTQGRHLESKDKFKTIVHEDFAKKNNLKIGDVLKMKASEYDIDNTKPSKEVMELEIVGLFSGTNLKTPQFMEEMSENVILTDLETVRTLYNFTEKNEIYHDATYFAESPKTLDSTMKKAEKLPLDWKNFTMRATGSEYAALSRSVEGMDKLVNTLLIGACVVGVAVLSLILFLWIHGRTKETGIMMALGISKRTILLQYVLELLLIAVVSFTFAFFAGKQTAQSIGDRFVQQSSQNAVRSVNQEAGGMIGADMESSALIKTIDKIDVSVDAKDMIAVCGLGVVVIIISVSLSSIPIIRMKPKEILSQMS